MGAQHSPKNLSYGIRVNPENSGPSTTEIATGAQRLDERARILVSCRAHTTPEPPVEEDLQERHKTRL